MKIRVMATPGEATTAVAALREALDVVEVDGPYPNRRDSQLVRVYLQARAPQRRRAMTGTPTRAELLTALQAVREAIDIPPPATVGDAEIRAQILGERLRHAVIFLDRILSGYSTVDIPSSVEYLRGQLAKHPAEGYKTWDELKAELKIDRPRRAGRPDLPASAGAQQMTHTARDRQPRRGHRPGRPALDSEPWTCRGCGRQLIGRRTPDDLCDRCIREALS